MKDEKDLIRQAQTGDREAFCELATIYGRRLHIFALRYCRRAADAEDLSQEVWLRAFRAIKDFRGEATFYTWLRRIAINTFLTRQRLLEKFELETEGDFESLNGWHEDFSERLHEKLLVEKVRGFLAELTATQRLIFLLKYDEEMTCSEIAAELDCSIGTVKKTLFRTTHKLRERLDLETKRAPKIEI